MTPWRRLVTAAALTLGLVAGPLAVATPALAGEDNAAVAINTHDGADIFRLAFDIREVAGEVVDHSNGAAAYASCEDCQTIAIAIQVVLVTNEPSTVAPENVAIAINENCSACETFAAAYQIVIGTNGPVQLTAEGRRRIAKIRHELEELKKRAPDMSLAEIDAEVRRLVGELKSVLATELVPQQGKKADVKSDDEATASATASPSASPSPSEPEVSAATPTAPEESPSESPTP